MGWRPYQGWASCQDMNSPGAPGADGFRASIELSNRPSTMARMAHVKLRSNNGIFWGILWHCCSWFAAKTTNGARLCLSALRFRDLRPVDCETFWTEVDDYTGFLSDVYEMPARSNLSQWLLPISGPYFSGTASWNSQGLLSNSIWPPQWISTAAPARDFFQGSTEWMRPSCTASICKKYLAMGENGPDTLHKVY